MKTLPRHPGLVAGEDADATLPLLLQALPPALIEEVAGRYRRPGQRRRKLPVPTLLLLVLAMNLYTQDALEVVFLRLIAHQRGTAADERVSRSALCHGRTRLGLRPVLALFRAVACPLAIPTTPGAFLWGMRVVALDATVDVVPDSPANARAFGRPTNQHGAAAYPQVRGLYLVEVGTHAVLAARFWPCLTSDHRCAPRLLRSLRAGMLLLADAGLSSAALVDATRRRDVHYLGCLPACVKPTVLQVLPDGSAWTLVQGPDAYGHPVQVRVRIIQYRLTDPARPHYGEERRLVTTLLDPQRYPIVDVILAYHERWEIEHTISELATRQRLANAPLRSETPLGVLQELYGLLVVHTALQTIRVQAAQMRGVDPDRISFTRTVQIVRAMLPVAQALPQRRHAAFYRQILGDIGASLLPPRANRSNPRVVKRQQSKFVRKRAEHEHIPPLTLPFTEAFVLLPIPAPPPPPPRGARRRTRDPEPAPFPLPLRT